MDIQAGLSLLTFLAPSPVLPLVDPRFKKASPLTHLALNVAQNGYGETPNVTQPLETKYKDGSAENVAYDSQIQTTFRKLRKR